MNWIDKILLVMLIGMLPLAVVATYVWMEDETGQEENLKALDAAKFEALVNQAQSRQTAQLPPSPKPFRLAQVEYASESGKLSVAGTAPQGQASVVVTATVLPRDYDVDELSSAETVKGMGVETFVALPKSDGEFELELDIDKKHSEGLVELRLEQETSVTTIRFDLKEGKQVY